MISKIINRIFNLLRHYMESFGDYLIFIQRKLLSYPSLNSTQGKTVFWHCSGFVPIWNFTLFHALALRLRGEDVLVVVCDGFRCGSTGSCLGEELHKAKPQIRQKNCTDCYKKSLKKINSYGIPCITFSELLTEEDIQMIQLLVSQIQGDINSFSFIYKDINLTEGIKATLYRIFLTELYDFTDEDIKRAAFTAALNLEISIKLGYIYKIKRIFCLEASYIEAYGLIDFFTKRNIQTICLSASAYSNAFSMQYMKKDRTNITLHLSDEDWNNIKNKKLTSYELDLVNNFFENKYKKNTILRDNFQKIKQYSRDMFIEKYLLDKNKKTFILFTHLLWDGLDYRSNIHRNMSDWVFDSIDMMLKNDSVNWLIRFHPAEISRGTPFKRTLEYAILQRYPQLPKHISLITHTDGIDAKDLFDIADGCITCFGSVGMEFSIKGKPVVTALKDSLHYVHKGFTFDSTNLEEYHQRLLNIQHLPSLNEEQIELAQKYLYTFYYRRSFPMKYYDIYHFKQTSWNLFDIQKGKDSSLDLAYDCMEKNKSFLLR